MKNCELCKNKRYIIEYDDVSGEEVYVPCKCKINTDLYKIRENKLSKANIPKMYWDYTMESYMQLPILKNEQIYKYNKRYIDIVCAFIENPKKFIDNFQIVWIWGIDPNAGHTTIASILLYRLIDYGLKGIFIKMQDLLEMFTNFENKTSVLTQLDTFSVYLIDDAFDNSRSSYGKEYIQVSLFNWLDKILSGGKYIICTSNVSIDRIDTNYQQCKIILNRAKSVSLNFKGSIQFVK